ncbi:MAG: permease-like cell division protein FtsX [Bacteroidales bacterium]|nr:permease-like cell division protein FtsX [Bacteroidales bacterium]
MNTTENARIRRKVVTSTVTTVVSITLVLFMLGVIGLLLVNARRISQYVREHISISLTIAPAATEAQVKKLQTDIEAMPSARKVEYISAEAAARLMQEELGENFTDILQYNPLSATMEVFMKAEYANPDSMAMVEQQLKQSRVVQDVYYQKVLVSTISSHIRRISIVILCFAGLLLLVAIALINNTIRLVIYERRFLIYNMQLVGATAAFIRRPLVGRGVLQGTVASILAMALLWLLMCGINRYVSVLFTADDWRIWAVLFAVLLVCGVLLCAVCTAVAVNRYLKTSLDKLYY